MIVIRALGALEIRGSPEPLAAILADQEAAAVLAYLVLARPGITHHFDDLVRTFWPGLDPGPAMAALDRVLDLLQEQLPPGVLDLHGQDQVGVVPRLVSCDAYDFEDAVAAHRWRRALQLYRGPLLDGLDVAGAVGYHEWRDAERKRFRKSVEQAELELDRAAS